MNPGLAVLPTPLPTGFTAGGINCGVRKYRPDLGLILSEQACVAAGVFTQNQCAAAPVQHCRGVLPSADIRGIITNSGQANAATGGQGFTDNQAMLNAFARAANCYPHQLLTASTGVIGEAMAVDKIVDAAPKVLANMTHHADKFSLAILTTDLVPKTVYKDIVLSGGVVRITGICKGSGMIHPNMATMLGYLLTDAALGSSQAQDLLSDATAKSFNMVSVDGETSTNDSVFLLANGLSGVSLQTANDVAVFKQAIDDISIFLAQCIARDGEGASKFIEVTVAGVATLELARELARSLTVSPLIKTAIHGQSPNWGRVIARLGMMDIEPQSLEQCKISIQGVTIFAAGRACDFDGTELNHLMKDDDISLHIQLQAGNCAATAWGCDLSEDYVKINADYLT